MSLYDDEIARDNQALRIEMEETKSEYDKQAEDFLNATGSVIEWRFLGYGSHFEGDNENRLRWGWTLKRGGRSTSGEFGQSIVESYKQITGDELSHRRTIYEMDRLRDSARTLKAVDDYATVKRPDKGSCSLRSKLDKIDHPRAYDLLARLQKHEPENLDEFAANYFMGDAKNLPKISRIVDCHAKTVAEYQGLLALYNEEEMDLLQEIC